MMNLAGGGFHVLLLLHSHRHPAGRKKKNAFRKTDGALSWWGTHKCSSTPVRRGTRSPVRRRCSAGTSLRTWWARGGRVAGCTPTAWSPAEARSSCSRGSWPCRGRTARRCPPCACCRCSGGSRCPGSRWRSPASCSPPCADWTTQNTEQREVKTMITCRIIYIFLCHNN